MLKKEFNVIFPDIQWRSDTNGQQFRGNAGDSSLIIKK
jgi:hypothetical protein